MSFPRGEWDPWWEEDLLDALLALGTGHQPYRCLSCSHDHAVDLWHPQGDMQGGGSRPGQGLKAPGRPWSLGGHVPLVLIQGTWSAGPHPSDLALAVALSLCGLNHSACPVPASLLDAACCPACGAAGLHPAVLPVPSPAPRHLPSLPLLSFSNCRLKAQRPIVQTGIKHHLCKLRGHFWWLGGNGDDSELRHRSAVTPA